MVAKFRQGKQISDGLCWEHCVLCVWFKTFNGRAWVSELSPYARPWGGAALPAAGRSALADHWLGPTKCEGDGPPYLHLQDLLASLLHPCLCHDLWWWTTCLFDLLWSCSYLTSCPGASKAWEHWCMPTPFPSTHENGHERSLHGYCRSWGSLCLKIL